MHKRKVRQQKAKRRGETTAGGKSERERETMMSIDRGEPIIYFVY